MGLYKKDEKDANHKEQQREVVKTSTACFGSILVSVAGGLILGWWEYQYHPANRQLWMVPFGLILFATPVIVWFSVVASDICNLEEEDDDDHHVTRVMSQPVHPLNDSVPAKKDDQWSNLLDVV